MITKLPTSIGDGGPDDHAAKSVVFRRGGGRVSDAIDSRELLFLQLFGNQMNKTMERSTGHDVDEETMCG